MERSRALQDRDNASQRSYGGRTLHTYTPMSHEDLLRSHLQLDAERKAQLQNDVKKLGAENNKLKQELDRAQQEINNKEEKINALAGQLTSKPRTPPDSRRYSQVIEVDGKPVTVEELLDHFNVVIQRHHDLLNRRNKEINKLQNDLNNQTAGPNRTEIQTQSSKPYFDEAALHQNLMNEFSREMALIRKDYEQVEYILTDRNKKQEVIIKNLQNKLDQDATEISYLRNELAEREKSRQPSESTVRLIREKEKENDYLKEIISSLKDQKQNIQEEPENVNEDLENEVKKIVEDKKIAIDKLTNMINDIKKDPSGSALVKPDLTEVERDCQTVLSDLNDTKEKLDSILLKLKQTPPSANEPINRNNLLSDLEQLMKQCQDEINALNNATGGRSSPSTVILRGRAVVKIDDPNYLRRKINEGEEATEGPIETSSNIKFLLYPGQLYPQSERRPRQQQRDVIPSYPEDHFDLRSKSPISSVKNIQEQTPVSSKHTHFLSMGSVHCEACGVDVALSKSVMLQPEEIPPRRVVEEVYTPVQAKQIKHLTAEKPTKQKPPKKGRGGCCGGKGSESSNAPYLKQEKVMQVHSPIHHEDPSPRSRSLSPPVKNKIYMK